MNIHRLVSLAILLGAIFLSAIDPTTAHAINKSGRISSNDTWSGTVHITGNTETTGGANITIKPGTKLVFDNNYLLKISTGSILSVQGNEANPIIIDAATAGGRIEIRGGKGLIAHTRMRRIRFLATYPQLSPPLVTMEDSVIVGGYFSASRQKIILRRNIIQGSGKHTVGGVPEGSEISDNVFVGGTWVTKGLAGRVRGNVFVSEFIPSGEGANANTHEHVLGMKPNTILEHNIFVGSSFASIMSIGSNNGSHALIRNNTIDQRGRGSMFMIHLADPRPEGIVFRNNLFMRGGGIQDEQSWPDAIAYTDYNMFVRVGSKYPGVVITGKKPGDAGFGKYSKEATDVSDVVKDPNIGYPFPFTNSSIFSGHRTPLDVLSYYRNAYSLTAQSPAINAGAPIDNGDPVVVDGKIDIGAMELGGNNGVIIQTVSALEPSNPISPIINHVRPVH